MSQKPVRVGLIGAGYIATWHANALRATKDVELTAICDVSPAAASDFAGTYGIQAFNSIEDLAAADVCDAVHILTPPNIHANLAQQCLNAGFHVMVEKPFALSRAESAAVEVTAAETGRKIAVCHNFLGVPAYESLKKACRSGELGRINSAEFNWRFPLAPLRAGPYGLWMLQEAKNLLFELGPHLYAFAVDLFGEVQDFRLEVGKPITLPGGHIRPQSWQIRAQAGTVDLTFNLDLVETMDDRSVVVHGSSATARLDYAVDTLTVRRENTSDIVINPFRQQMDLAGQHLRAGMVNGVRQLTSLNRKSPYALSFQGAFEAFYNAVRDGREVDARFSVASAIKVIGAIEQTVALIPKDYTAHPAPVDRASPLKPTAMVIGGTGFIGRNLTRALVKSGRKVRVLSRGRHGPFEDIADQVETVAVSLRDKEGLTKAMKGIEVVYNLAKSMDSTWEGCLENDVGTAVRVAEAALDAGVKRLVYTGTIASYDMSDPTRTITENTGFGDDMSDRNLYARSKAECEKRLMEMHETKGLPVVIARPGIVIGEGGPLQHWGIGRWHGAGAVRIWGNGRNILPFVLIDDISDALIALIDADDAVGQSFNLIGEPMMSARDYFDAIHEALGARIEVKPGAFWTFYLSGSIKYLLKRYVVRLKDLNNQSYSDWKSRGHLSPFSNDHTKQVLGWKPEADRDAFIRKGIIQANLFGH